MSQLPSVTGDQAIAAFKQIGFEVVRVKGSHHIMKREGHRFLLTIPVHGRTEIKPGTLRQLIRNAELSIDQFCDLLSR